MNEQSIKPQARNTAFSILTGIGILTVILGHLDFSILTFWNLFPYYSYHVMIFVFVSGYFYKDEDSLKPIACILRKAKRLILPYYVWNLIYGLFITLLHQNGFSFGEPLTIRNLLLEPILGGHQFALNFPSWFVPALFLVQVINVLGRFVLTKIHLDKEWLLLILSMIIGITVVYLAQTGHVWGYYKTPGRLLFMLPMLELGIVYRKYIEPKTDKLFSRKDNPLTIQILFFVILALIQFITVYFCNGIAYSTVWCTSFANLPFVPYLTSITGIALWLRISKIISNEKRLPFITRLSKGLSILGDNSFDLMMHHITGFFVLNTIIYLINNKTGIMAGFDENAFLSNVNYVYSGFELAIARSGSLFAFLFKLLWNALYIAFGILFPLAMHKITFFLTKLVKSATKDGLF